MGWLFLLWLVSKSLPSGGGFQLTQKGDVTFVAQNGATLIAFRNRKDGRELTYRAPTLLARSAVKAFAPYVADNGLTDEEDFQ